MSGQESDQGVQDRLAALRRNVIAALEGKAIPEIAAQVGLDPEEVNELIAGSPAADLYVLARLEAALGVSLWPVGDGPGDADGDSTSS